MKEDSEWKSFTNLSRFHMDGGTNFEISENPKMLYFSTIAITNVMAAMTSEISDTTSFSCLSILHF